MNLNKESWSERKANLHYDEYVGRRNEELQKRDRERREFDALKAKEAAEKQKRSSSASGRPRSKQRGSRPESSQKDLEKKRQSYQMYAKKKLEYSIKLSLGIRIRTNRPVLKLSSQS